MNQLMLTKNFYLIILYIIFIPIIAYFILKVIKSNDKKEKKKLGYIAAIPIVFIFMSPLEKYVDFIPFKHKKIEQAFNFNYNSKKYDLAYKKRYNDTYFIYGKSKDKNKPFDEYSCYYNTKNGWRILYQPSDQRTGRISPSVYEIYYCNNKKDNITGIFISSTIHGSELNNKTEITDKYGTKFNYIVDKKQKPIKYNYSKSYVYFGIVEHNVSSQYYIKINEETVKFKEK